MDMDLPMDEFSNSLLGNPSTPNICLLFKGAAVTKFLICPSTVSCKARSSVSSVLLGLFCFWENPFWR